jgi:hypothetical protein
MRITSIPGETFRRVFYSETVETAQYDPTLYRRES